MMAVIMFLFGMWFYKSEGKATKFLSGYNIKSADERKKYDENAMCKAYGKRMMFMSVVTNFNYVTSANPYQSSLVTVTLSG